MAKLVFDGGGLLSPSEVEKVWDDAFSDVRSFMEADKNNNIEDLLCYKKSEPFLDFALRACKYKPIIEPRKIKHGFGSWLTFTSNCWATGNPKFGIGLAWGAIHRLYTRNDPRDAEQDHAATDGFNTFVSQGDRRGKKGGYDRRESTSWRARFRGAQLVLHEIAHLKYHNRYLTGQPPAIPGKLAGWAREEHEAIAWLYSGLVTGIITGHCAYELRLKSEPDSMFMKK